MKSSIRNGFIFISMLLVAISCATPNTRFPRIAENKVDEQRVLNHKDIIQTHFELMTRLQSIAWPVLRDNAELCTKKSKSYIGAGIGNDKSIAASIGGLKSEQVRAAGYDEKLRVLVVARDSPAHRAGVQVGDQIESINGHAVSEKNYSKLWAEVVKKDNAEPVLVFSNAQGEKRSVTLQLQESCLYTINLDKSQAFSAFTNGKTLSVTSGMLRQVKDDRLITYVIGHELGHATYGHVKKGVRNFIVSGAFVVAPVVGIVGFTLDLLLDIVGVESVRMPGSSTTQAVMAAMTKSRDFEREADYLGLYFYARSGGDMSHLEEIFEIFARIDPKSTWGKFSHPVSPERILSIVAAREEVRQKKIAGEALIPNGFEMPQKIND